MANCTLKACGITTLIGLCIAATSAAYGDTTMYKWVDKNGVVSFSQTPPTTADNQNVTTITIETLPIEQQRAAQRMLRNLDKEQSDQASTYQKNLGEADQKVAKAIANLAAAEQHLTHDSVPTGDDRIGNDGEAGNHHARLRDSYFARVARLQANVEKAKKDLQDAYNQRDGTYP